MKSERFRVLPQGTRRALDPCVTFYTRFGDVFVWLSFIALVILVVLVRRLAAE